MVSELLGDSIIDLNTINISHKEKIEAKIEENNLHKNMGHYRQAGRL